MAVAYISAAALLVPSDYPALDVVVPTDSPEVQQWIKDVAASGVIIPNITQTVAGVINSAVGQLANC